MRILLAPGYDGKAMLPANQWRDGPLKEPIESIGQEFFVDLLVRFRIADGYTATTQKHIDAVKPPISDPLTDPVPGFHK